MKSRIMILAILFIATIVYFGCDFIGDRDTLGGPYTVSFIDYDQTVLKVESVDHGDSATPPGDPERTGYTFTGWSASYEEIINDLIVYAEYSPTVYDIIYHLDFGEFETTYPTEYTIETEDFDLVVPTKVGHTFDGWYDELSEGQLISSVSQGSMETLEFYARWLINQYSITYETNEGSLIDSLEEDYGALIEAPIPPTKELSLFEGWYLDETFTEPFVFTTMPAENITLYAKWVIVNYTVTFEDYDGVLLKTQTVDHGEPATPPDEPYREGYTFIGWDSAFDTITSDLIVVAQYTINSYLVIYYEEDGVTIIESTSYEYGADLSGHVEPDAAEKEGYTFDGWVALPATMPTGDVTRVATYIFDVNNLIHMVQVGETVTTYTIPIYDDDFSTVTVMGEYLMATTQTTYELWYEVRIWAEAHGYHFQNPGREGSHGTDGATPTASKLEPVTRVSWRDTIVWLNALSEMSGFNPVYRTSGGSIIKDSRDTNGTVVDAAIQTSNTGYRLPTSYEWEMAARWKDDTESTDGSILVGGRYWTPGNYASGATANTGDAAATQLVAWYEANSGFKTQPVGQLLPNHLGIYDMSGNVGEWTFTVSGSRRVVRGGSWGVLESDLKVGVGIDGSSSFPYLVSSASGFRFVRITGYTVTFEDYDGTLLKMQRVEDGNSATAPDDPERVGYTFTGWDIPFDNITSNLTVVAQYTVDSYLVIYYEEDGVTIVQSTSYEYGADLSGHVEPDAPDKEGYTFDGWVALPATMPAGNVTQIATYSPEINIPMVQVGETDTTYTIPTGTGDSGTATVTGGYLMATTQTTYELWYEVRIWAEAHGYHFGNQGREGSHGNTGQAPTEAKKHEPVTYVSWRDTIVWLNALSEMKGFNPVYRTSGGDIIKDSRVDNAAVVNAAIQTSNNGYRLPTSNEWEMAARWKDDTESTHGSILVDGRYWTPGNYASGATTDYNNSSATRAVAWYGANSGSKTQLVGQLLSNHLGIYDMSGNVWEWTYTASGSNRVMRGGSWFNSADDMRVGSVVSSGTSDVSHTRGFRFVRNP